MPDLLSTRFQKSTKPVRAQRLSKDARTSTDYTVVVCVPIAVIEGNMQVERA